MPLYNTDRAWGGIARFLHWTMAALILAMLVFGTIMVDWPDGELQTKFALYQWHKSFGFVVLGLLVLRVLWRSVQPVPPPTRRRLLEHVEAAGHFLWRRNRRAELIANVRHALDARMCRVHPGWADLTAREREQHLARLTGMELTEIHELLHREDYAHPQDFARLIKTLETIRKQL